MNTEIGWIKDALARDRTKTQSGLAQAMNIDKSSVSRLLRGERRLKFSESRIAATYLGVSPPTGFTEESEEFHHEESHANAFTPLLRAATVAEKDFWLLDHDDIIEQKPRPPQFIGVSAAYGFYVPDNAMAPRFRIGEIAWINPARPAVPGEDALLVAAQKADRRDKVFLCELREIQDEYWRVHQYGGGNTRSFSRSEWRALHVFSRA